jgi:hypothetical protein
MSEEKKIKLKMMMIHLIDSQTAFECMLKEAERPGQKKNEFVCQNENKIDIP